jgi:DNA-directed RNA polymerase specialized sigma24 family protein
MAAFPYTTVLPASSDLIRLVEGCLHQDRESQRLLYLRYYGWALRIAFRYVGTYEASKKVVHDSFLRLFRSFEQQLPGKETGIEAMLLRGLRDSVIQTSVTLVQTGSRHLKPFNADEDQFGIWCGLLPAEDTTGRDRHQLLICRLVALPATLRLAFNLRAIDGYGPVEAAWLLGVSERRLGRRVSKARNMLRAATRSE